MRPLYERLSEAKRLTTSGDLQGAVASIQAELTAGVFQPNAQPPNAAWGNPDIVQRSLKKLGIAMASQPLLLDHEPSSEAEARKAHVSTNDVLSAAQFLSDRFANEAGTRDFRLFVPPTQHGKLLPLVVMLHGCTQDPETFAAGTAMNEIALSRGFFVLYPAQAQSSNANRCWNWFEPGHQRRDAGEPAILAGMTREVMNHYGIDPRRIYVAGLSAGGAMAVLLGDLYPDLYAAVGAHSGLPSGVANDLPSALATMKGAHAFGAKAALRIQAIQRRESSISRLERTVPPTIVFHGDQDKIVRPTNGDQIIASCLRSASSGSHPSDLRQRTENGRSNNGREYTRISHEDSDGHLISEQWTIHGAGHAWSGGRKEGSYTDPHGPNASEEIIRFFLAHQLSS